MSGKKYDCTEENGRKNVIFFLVFVLFFRLETLQILLVVVAVIVGCYSIMLAVFGFLATGATRGNLYSGAKCIMGGRVAATFVSLTMTVNIRCQTKIPLTMNTKLLNVMTKSGWNG